MDGTSKCYMLHYMLSLMSIPWVYDYDYNIHRNFGKVDVGILFIKVIAKMMMMTVAVHMTLWDKCI